MKVRTKKTVKGKPVVIFDTEGMGIAELVPEMIDEGWNFSKLVATYTNKQGEKVRKAVSPAKAPALYQKHPQLRKWSFSAYNGDATVNGTIDCSKDAVAITRSTNNGVRFFANLGSSYVSAVPKAAQPQQAYEPYPREEQAYGQYQPYQPQQQAYEPEAADTAIVARNIERREGTAAPADPNTAGNKSRVKFWIMRIIAIIELFGLASTTFAILALVEIHNAWKEPDEKLSHGFLVTARTLLIGGAITALMMVGVVLWFNGFPFGR